jgi:hypothetical protein
MSLTPKHWCGMGITALIPDMTIGQLIVEAEERWGEMWDDQATRMKILLILPRKQRKLLELHGDMVEHGQPVITVFHRPRAEAKLLEEQGLDARDASFQFVDLATPDMGPWLQHLITSEGWLRGTIEVSSIPFSMGLPNQRPFESEMMLCFRHPSLPQIETYYLPFPPSSIPGKCFVSLPRRQAAEMARQQAEVLGIGRLQKKVNITAVEPTATQSVEAPAPVTIEVESNIQSVTDGFSQEVMASVAEEVATNDEISFVPLPGAAPVAPVLDPAVEHSTLESSFNDSQPTDDDNSVSLPEPEVEDVPEMSDVEIEFRELVTGLMAAGIEPAEMMNDPRWEDLGERALAIGFETWPVFLQLTSMG